MKKKELKAAIRELERMEKTMRSVEDTPGVREAWGGYVWHRLAELRGKLVAKEQAEQPATSTD